MSSPNDVNVRVKFTANSTQLKQMFTQMRKLSGIVRTLSKNVTKLGADMRKMGSRFDTATRKIKKLTKGTQKQKVTQDSMKNSLKKLTGGMNKSTGAMKKMEKQTKKAGQSLGFTGLAFGFVGGIAGFAANQIRTQFISVLEDTASIMSEISRINLFSDTGVKDGIISLEGLERQTERVLKVGRDTGIEFQDIAELLKNVEKAAPLNLDVDVFGDIVADMKLLENELDTQTIAADIITIQSNFEELSLAELTDQVFTFGKANKLTFSASAKAVGFAAQGAKLLGSDLEEVNRVLTVVSNRIPGFQGNAGRGLRRLETAFSNDKTVAFLASTGVELVNTEGRFIGLEAAITKTADKFNEFNEENQLKGAQFLRLIGLTENARLTLLAYADASDEAKAAVAEQFLPENVQGSFQLAAEFQKTQPEAILGKLKNQITELKIAFTTELFPALSQINDLLSEAFADKEMISTIKQLGAAIGQGLVVVVSFLVPLLKLVSSIFKGNKPLIDATAAAFLILVGALTAMSIVFPLLGGFFALIFLHEKLIARSISLGAKASFVTKAYVRMFAAISRVASGLVKLFSFVGRNVLAGLTAGFRFISTAFLAAGARAAAFFSAAFNIISNAVIFAGGFVKNLFIRISAAFATAGAAIGLAFGGAYNSTVFATMRAAAWIQGIISALTLRFATAGAVIGAAFGGAFTAASALIIRAGAWITGIITALSTRFAVAGAAIGAFFGGAFTAASRLIMIAGAWLSAIFASLRNRFIIGGLAAGGFFGGAFTGASAAIMRASAWITAALAGAGLYTKAGAVAGARFGAAFRIAVIAALVALPFVFEKEIREGFRDNITNFGDTPENQAHFDKMPTLLESLISLFTSKDEEDVVTPGIDPRKDTFGTQPSNFPPITNVALSAGLNTELETVTKNSIGSFEDINAALDALVIQYGLDNVAVGDHILALIKTTDGLSEAFDVPEISQESVESLNREFETFATAIEESRINAQKTFEENFGSGSNFANPDFFAPKEEGFTSTVIGKGEGLDEILLAAGFDPVAIAEAGEKFRAFGEAFTEEVLAAPVSIGENKELLDENSDALEKVTPIVLTNADTVATSTNVMGLLSSNLGLQIIETIKNINIQSAMTTKIAEVNLMFTKLVAEGNRAAGKLSSLRVSTSGKFSITDPGISGSDQAAINAASANLASTRANQTSIAIPTAQQIQNQTNVVTINPTINIENATGLDAEEVVALINAAFEQTLQKNIPTILTV